MHRFELRVYYEDTDLSGLVYHANYLKFAERARSEALAEAGIDQLAIKNATGTTFAVRAAAIDYRAPARLGDQLLVTTQMLRATGARAELAQNVWKGDTLLVSCRIMLAALGADGRATRLPVPVRAALAQLGAAAAGP